MDSITDPAWFYSSLAQVSAAIFGIIGAVFATRIADYTKSTRDAFDNIQRLLHDRRSRLRNIESALGAQVTVKEDRRTLSSIAALYETLTGKASPEQIDQVVTQVDAVCRQLQHPSARSTIDTYAVDLRACAYQLREFRNMARPGSLWAMWGLLTWVTVVGVIWPLLALPGLKSVPLSKSLILGFFSLGALAFILFLLRELVLLWRLTSQFEWR